MPESVSPVTVYICRRCAAAHGARPFRCESCGADEIEPREVEGRGRLFTWTVVRRPPDAFARGGVDGPLTVALVDLDAGPRLTCSLEYSPGAPAEPELGARVRVTEVRQGVPHCVVC